VHQALQLAAADGMHFGEALVQTGAATVEDVRAALAYQARCCHEPVPEFDEAGPDDLYSDMHAEPQPSEDGRPTHDLRLLSDVLLGRILLNEGVIDQDQLARGLQVHHSLGVRLGEALVHIGAADWKDVAMALRIQSGHTEREAS